MSFPHRTAFYIPELEEIFYPEEVEGSGIWMGNGIIHYKPDIENDYENISLASTGLEDSEGNEIFEGHVLSNRIYRRAEPEITVVFYDLGHFSCWSEETGQVERHPYLQEQVGSEYDHKSEVIGHALTDPKLVPDSFDTEEYFDGI